MESDRELLELAAKAAGYQIHIWGTPGEENCARMDTTVGDRWNPITDDGDALRLAVKLRITVHHPNPADLGGGYVTARLCLYRYRYHFLKESFFVESFDGDDCAAVRRAIVRAAAEIGKTLG